MEDVNNMNSKERELIKASMSKAAATGNIVEMAGLFGGVYDKEVPIPTVIEAVAQTVRADVGEDVDYLTPTDPSEVVFTINANCTITENKVSPSADAELTFTNLISDKRYTCVHNWLEGKHNVLKLHTDAIMENMNRQEEYTVLQLIDAGATSAGNTFTLTSGTTKFDYPKLVDMAKVLRKYGSRLVLITGCDVSTDIDLLDYDSDKNREHAITRIVDDWIRIENYDVTINGSGTDVIGDNVAYLVATSDSANRKPILFARRKTSALTMMNDTTQGEKERIIVVGGNLEHVGSEAKLARSVLGFGQYGGVTLNTAAMAKFTRT